MNQRASRTVMALTAKLLSILLLVLCVGPLGIPGAQAYPAGESIGDIPDGTINHHGNTACPVEGKTAPHGVLQRLTMEYEQLQTRYPMTPVASCGQPAPGLQAQIPMGLICRWGPYFCYLIEPLPVGTSCCCDAGFCGAVTTQ